MTTSPAVFSGLLGGDLSGLVFTPFRPGVDICRLADNAAGETTLALLRYGAGASVPRHMHPDTETIIVLTGAQSDERGTYRAGDVVVNAPGSAHRVWSDNGCLVLISWGKPVRILDDAPHGDGCTGAAGNG
ncbi:anti-ECFsigma factor [Gluconacetobacter sp. SXCC-1]|uniref:Allophanate hydrolase n=1 Tax=Komagataeibacter rhaeticus TaxID=215221 RepID=A0A181CBK9_9PROT|nr:cupin domain-containing protein [Komagataeibacter rhaeticus]ATU72382.1 allophanate hydrolase [Komagataeibacter xylinus]EGG75015.1 anti-ECFsigma factor [Gluconacetobacter sp. SXCC-1]QIP35710.1 allophanate hydrolase [Komagataeibacter rhaeticus]QOC45468.1 cupin domain-containing protein [Komagataeibacter rhaeticus]WPP22120.1 cupin domain-containing protein [Komagataeibacter rhaeticus]